MEEERGFKMANGRIGRRQSFWLKVGENSGGKREQDETRFEETEDEKMGIFTRGKERKTKITEESYSRSEDDVGRCKDLQ